MNLIERARAAADGSSHVWRDIAALLQELAGEVERCWARIEALEEADGVWADHVKFKNESIAQLEAEIERLKAAKDLDALARASQAGYQHGFRTAITTLWPVVGTLLKDHHYGEEA